MLTNLDAANREHGVGTRTDVGPFLDGRASLGRFFTGHHTELARRGLEDNPAHVTGLAHEEKVLWSCEEENRKRSVKIARNLHKLHVW